MRGLTIVTLALGTLLGSTVAAQDVLPADADAPIAPLEDTLVTLPLAGDAFEVHPGDTLRETLQRWSAQTGWTLIWDSQVDYPLEAALAFPAGTDFRTAAKATLRAFWGRRDAPVGTAYRNRVLVITRRNG